MKHSLIILLTAIICVASFIIPVAAYSTDSLCLNAEEESRLDVSSDDTVVKLFCGSFMKDFSEQEDIANIVEKSDIMYLIAKSSGEIVYKNYYNGEIVELNPLNRISDWSDFYTYAVSSNSVFDSAVKVNKVYCLNGEPSHDGVYIYYDTDEGDYVLFKEYLSADESYLFPISDFYEFSAVVYNDRLLHKDADGGGTAIDELFDLESYLYKPTSKPTSNFQWMTIGLVICITFVAVGGILYLSRRKKQKS